MVNDRIEKAYSENGPLPDGREKALAQTKLEEACMWAVKAVAHAEGE